MTNVAHMTGETRRACRPSSLQWRGPLLRQYGCACCRLPRRSSFLTNPPPSTRMLFNQLPRSWWSHCVASFLPRHLVRLVRSCPESSVPEGKGGFYEKKNLQRLWYSSMWTGEHAHSLHQSLGSNETANDPRHYGRFRRFHRSLDHLDAGIAPSITLCASRYEVYEREAAARKTHIPYLKTDHGLMIDQTDGGHHGELEAQNENPGDSGSIRYLFSTASSKLPEMRRSHGERNLHRPTEQQ